MRARRGELRLLSAPRKIDHLLDWSIGGRVVSDESAVELRDPPKD